MVSGINRKTKDAQTTPDPIGAPVDFHLLRREALLMEITYTKSIDDAELMSAVFDNLHSSWVSQTDWDWQANPTQTSVEVTYEDPEDAWGGLATKTVTVEELGRAFEQILKDGRFHCGMRISPELDEGDSCVSDFILQYALFGELIYC